MKSPVKPMVLTCGDPSGVGPELTISAFKKLGHLYRFCVIGDLDQLTSLAEADGVKVSEINSPDESSLEFLGVIPQKFASKPMAGHEQTENAISTIETIRRAVDFAKNGEVSAIITNPINKRILMDGAGFSHPGHTEYLAELDDKTQSVMMLVSSELRVIPATIHCPLIEVAKLITPRLLMDTIRTLDHSLRIDFGCTSPTIAVAGLNPHAGEGGKMGTEEIEIIVPTLNSLRNEGLNVVGPMSADTMFHSKARQTYDAAVCMYHDQALIPIKTIDFDRGVNATLGLSFIRTSPDHGTAFDIAGKGIASHTSLTEAIKLAAQMAENRASYG